MSTLASLILVVFLHSAGGCKNLKLSADPCAYVTQDVFMNCSTDGDSKDLQFEVGNSPHPRVHILDNHTASITLENVTMSMNRANIVCKDKGESNCVAYQLLRVFEKPEHDVNLTCIVYDWTDPSMTCSWHLRKNYHVAPNVTVKWRISGYKDCAWTPCPNHINNTCHWRNTDDGDFSRKSLDLAVTVGPGTNKRKCLDKQTTYYKINTKTIVKPRAVDNLRSHAINSTCLQLSWKPNQSVFRNLYKITCTNKWGDVMVEEIEDTRERQVDKVMIGQLHPYTEYLCTVLAKPAREYWSGNDSTACKKCNCSETFSCITNSGFWSDAKTTNVSTYESVPSAAPAMTQGGFMINPGDCEQNLGYRDVSLYWKALNVKDRNGPLKGYDITFQSVEGGQEVVERVSMDSTFYSRRLKCDIEYKVSILARNTKGNSPTSSIIIPPVSKGLSAPSFFVEMSNYTDREGQREVEVAWSEVASSHNLTGYTVFRCRKEGGNCAVALSGEINWQSVAKDILSLSFNISEPESYMYGVSMETTEGSSGFHGQSCVYTKEAEPEPPKNIMVRAQEGGSNLVVNWDKLPCEPGGPYIVKYIVRRCEMGLAETKCEDVEVPAEKHSVEILELKEEHGYGIKVRAVAKSGLTGPWSKVKQQTTNKVPDSALILGATMGPLLGLAVFSAIGFCVWRCRKWKHELEKKSEIEEIPITPEIEQKQSTTDRQTSSESGYEDGENFAEDGEDNEVEEIAITPRTPNSLKRLRPDAGYTRVFLTDSRGPVKYKPCSQTVELPLRPINEETFVKHGIGNDGYVSDMEQDNCSTKNDLKTCEVEGQGDYVSNDFMEQLNSNPESDNTEINTSQLHAESSSTLSAQQSANSSMPEYVTVQEIANESPSTSVTDEHSLSQYSTNINMDMLPFQIYPGKNMFDSSLPDTPVSDSVCSEEDITQVDTSNTVSPDTTVSDSVPSEAEIDQEDQSNIILPEPPVSDSVRSKSEIDQADKSNIILPEPPVSDYVRFESEINQVDKSNIISTDTPVSDSVWSKSEINQVDKSNIISTDTPVSDSVWSKSEINQVDKSNIISTDTTVSDSVWSKSEIDQADKSNIILPEPPVSDYVRFESEINQVDKSNIISTDTPVSDSVWSKSGINQVDKSNIISTDTTVSDSVWSKSEIDQADKSNIISTDTTVSDSVPSEAEIDQEDKSNTISPDTTVSDSVPSEAEIDQEDKSNSISPDKPVSDYVYGADIDPNNRFPQFKETQEHTTPESMSDKDSDGDSGYVSMKFIKEHHSSLEELDNSI